jgi:hypothetical protein
MADIENMRKFLHALLILVFAIAFTFCANKSNNSKLTEQSHAKSANPNYAIVFPNDMVNRIDIKGNSSLRSAFKAGINKLSFKLDFDQFENEFTIMTLLSMKSLEEKLPSEKFMRVHRSYIVNLEKVSTVERITVVFDNKHPIPVSDNYKKKFQVFLDRNFMG